MALEDLKLLVDVEADLDDRAIMEVRFGRSRFLRTAALALFGLATGLVATPPAEAAPTPKYCANAPGCNHCKGGTCTSPLCRRATTCGGVSCWTVSVPDGNGCNNIYKCCDWYKEGHSPTNECICRGFVRKQCPG
jgi:hypothetical protein